MQKPSETISTLKDLKLFLNFFVDGSYGLWIDKNGVPNVIVPKMQYRTLRKEIERRLVGGGQIRVRSQSVVNEVRLLFMRMNWRRENIMLPGFWEKLAWVVPAKLTYWCFLRLAARGAIRERRPAELLSVTDCLHGSGGGADHQENFQKALLREKMRSGENVGEKED